MQGVQGWHAPRVLLQLPRSSLWWYLDNRYEINRSRRRQLSQKEIARAEGTFVWYKVPKDMHSSDDGYGSHGSQNGRPTLSSGEEEEEEHAETGEDALEVSNAASPV